MQQPATTIHKGRQRNASIQFLRGFAILLVIGAHTCPEGIATIVFRPMLNVSVPLFIFLSGLLTKVDNDDWMAFFKKRIVRVLIPYIIWTVIYTIQMGKLKSLPVNLRNGTYAGQMYYIFVYVQLVLLTPVLGKLAKSKFRHMVWLISPIYQACRHYIPLLTGCAISGHLVAITTNICLEFIIYYYMGLMLGNHIMGKNFSVTKLAMLFALALLMQMGEAYGLLLLGNDNPGNPGITNMLTSVIFLLLVYALLERGSFKNCNRFLVMVGDYSFGLFLCHVLFKRLLQLTSFYDSLPFVVNSALVFAISLAFCLVVDKVFGARVSRWLGIR